MPTTVNSSFIGDFKLGDNIGFNLGILKTLYSCRAAGNPAQRRYLQKPIVVLNVSIIEAALYDLHYRAKNFTSEGIANLSLKVLEYIRLKKIDELEKYIASAKKHDFFDLADTIFYDRLDELRRLRNRVHIQNTKQYFEPDDHAAFSQARLLLSEQATETVLKTMARKYPRQHKYVADFVLPWDQGALSDLLRVKPALFDFLVGGRASNSVTITKLFHTEAISFRVFRLVHSHSPPQPLNREQQKISFE